MLRVSEDGNYIEWAAEHIARLDSNHANAIDANTFVTLLQQALATKKKRDKDSGLSYNSLGYDVSFDNIFKDLIRDTSIGGVEERIISGRVTLLDALDKCLTFSIGQHGQNSFKYMLICKMFNIKWGEGSDVAEKTVAAFIEAIKIEKAKKNKMLLEQTKQFIQVQFPQITTEEFLKILSNELGDDVSESESSEAPISSSSSSATEWLDTAVTFAQSTYKEKKHQMIDKMLADIKTRVASDQITNSEALLQALTLRLGQTGPHSGKFKLIYHLIKHQKQLAEFGLDKANIDANFARSLVDSFIITIGSVQVEQKMVLSVARIARVRKLVVGKVKDSMDAFLSTSSLFSESDDEAEKYALLKTLFGFNADDDKEAGELVACFEQVSKVYIGKMNEVFEAATKKLLKERLEGKLPTITPEALRAYSRSVLDEKLYEDAKNHERSVDLYGPSKLPIDRKLITDLRNGDRDKLLTEIFSDLIKERITVLDAIYRCLTLPIGMKGAHSYKFLLTASLFGLEDHFAINAEYIVNLFITVIEDEQARLDQVRLESVEKMVERFQANAVSISANFKTICENALTDSGKPAPQSVVMNLFSAGYKAIKSTARGFLLTPIYEDLEKGNITLLEAFYQVLSLAVGEQGQHSFKFNLLKNLFGRKGGDAEDLACVEKDDVRSAEKLIVCFTEVVGRAMKAEQVVASAIPENDFISSTSRISSPY